MAKMDTAGEWMVDSSHLYIPSAGIKVEHSNLAGASSGRTEDGVMHIDWVRRDLRKVYLQWKVLTGSEMDYIMSLMQGKEFTLTFKDRGKVQKMSAYSSLPRDYTIPYFKESYTASDFSSLNGYQPES